MTSLRPRLTLETIAIVHEPPGGTVVRAAGLGHDAVNFRQAFDAPGAPAMLDREAIKQSVDRSRASLVGAPPQAAQ